MVARRWIWIALAAAGGLWALRSAHAQDETDEAPPWPNVSRPGSAAAPRAAASAPRKPASAAVAPAARPRGTGYAAESARTATRLSRDERAARGFLREAAVIAKVQLEASRLAATRAGDPSVRAFADDLAETTGGAEAEMLHLLHARGMALPMMDTKLRKALVRLSRLNGPKFDREYLALAGPRAQRGTLGLYERAAHDVGDPALKGWIERQLPVLREQQAQSQRLLPKEAHRARAADVRPATLSRGPGGQRVE